MGFDAAVLIGPPCAGKSLISRTLAEMPWYHRFSSGEFIKEVLQENSSRGELIRSLTVDIGERYLQDSVMYDHFLNEIYARREKYIFMPGQLLLLDGIPRTIGQAPLFEDSLAPVHVKKAILLDVPLSTLEERYASRKKIENRADDLLHYEERYNDYVRNDQPLINWYAKRKKLAIIDGTQSPRDVQRAVSQQLEECIQALRRPHITQ